MNPVFTSGTGRGCLRMALAYSLSLSLFLLAPLFSILLPPKKSESSGNTSIKVEQADWFRQQQKVKKKKYCNPLKRSREWNEKRKSDSVIFVHVFFFASSFSSSARIGKRERERNWVNANSETHHRHHHHHLEQSRRERSFCTRATDKQKKIRSDYAREREKETCRTGLATANLDSLKHTHTHTHPSRIILTITYVHTVSFSLSLSVTSVVTLNFESRRRPGRRSYQYIII